MKRLLIILLIICAFSCERHVKIKKDNTLFEFSLDINEVNREYLVDEILFQIDNLGFEDLKTIKHLRIDTLPFSYLINIPAEDSISVKTENRYKAFAAILSDYSLDDIPIHLALTDNMFEVKKLIRFDPNAVKSIGTWIRTSITTIESSNGVEPFQLGGLEIVLLNQLSELYQPKGDTLDVKVDKVDEAITVDISVDTSIINSDTLKSQFIGLDPLPWYAMFDNRTIYFRIRDKSTRDLKAVYTLERM